MDEDLLRRKGVEPLNRRLASVKDFSLVIGQRATLVPSAGDTVHGVVFSLTPQDIESLYAEPSVSIYRPEAVIAFCDDAAIPALCFNLPTVDSSTERNSEYAIQLKQLASRLNLPAEYVDSI
jgi:hypothetical protein